MTLDLQQHKGRRQDKFLYLHQTACVRVPEKLSVSVSKEDTFNIVSNSKECVREVNIASRVNDVCLICIK